ATSRMSEPNIKSPRKSPHAILEKRGARRSAEERSVHISNHVRSFAAAPGIHEENLRKASRAQSKPGGIRVHPRIGAQVAAVQRNFSLIRGKCHPQRQLPDGMLKSFVQKHHIGCAKPVILKTRQSCIAIQIAPTQRGLKVKW